MFKKINDLLALVILVAIIPGLWIADALGVITVNPEVLGATIAAWTLILQFYFRKSPPAAGGTT